MRWQGAPFAPAAPHEARAAGVAMVFQHFSLFEALDVAENVALGMDNPPPLRRLAAQIRKVSHDYGLPLDPGQLVGDLSAGQRQRVEIVRCLLQDPQLLIMDEPTSVLTPQEVDTLFRTCGSCAPRGARSSTSRTSSRKSARSARRRRCCGWARWSAAATRARRRRANWPR
jgi:general nucleoside transport system ATP-binding protein